jgi:cytochrome c2
MVPGTIMVFWGLHADDRRRVIAYLKSAAAE